MKRLNRILVPTDLSDSSRRALSYGCWLAAEEQASLVFLHVANEFNAWEPHCEELAFVRANQRTWPIDRVLAEASLDLSRFLEPHSESLKTVPNASRRVVLGPIAQRIVTIAEAERADLIVMAPRRQRALRHFLSGGITDRVTRLSPCPVLSITAPLPSRSWRGRLAPASFGWPRHRPAEG